MSRVESSCGLSSPHRMKSINNTVSTPEQFRRNKKNKTHDDTRVKRFLGGIASFFLLRSICTILTFRVDVIMIQDEACRINLSAIKDLFTRLLGGKSPLNSSYWLFFERVISELPVALQAPVHRRTDLRKESIEWKSNEWQFPGWPGTTKKHHELLQYFFHMISCSRKFCYVSDCSGDIGKFQKVPVVNTVNEYVVVMLHQTKYFLW